MKSGTSSFSEGLQTLQNLTESLHVYLGEEGYRYPFRHKDTLSDGPRKRGDPPHKAAHKWDCDDCGKSLCRHGNCSTACDCTGIGSNEGHEKHVEIKKDYKKQYDKEYKAGEGSPTGHYPTWRARRSARAAHHSNS